MVPKPTIEEESSFAMVHNVTKKKPKSKKKKNKKKNYFQGFPLRTSVFDLFEEVEFLVGNTVSSINCIRMQIYHGNYKQYERF